MPKARVVARTRRPQNGQRYKSPQAIEEKLQKWHGVRRLVYDAVESNAVKSLISACIVLNTALVVYETDLAATCDGKASECETTDAFTRGSNVFFLAVYTLEMVARIYAHRKRYFTCPSDAFDMCIVVISLAGSVLGGALPNLGILRLFRVARVIRAVKVANSCDEVRVFISGLGSTFKAIVVGSVLIFFCIFLFAIAAVMLLNPVNQAIASTGLYDNCRRCSLAYSSVTQAVLTLIQVVIMGDAWGIYSVPLIEEAPWTIILFIVTSFSISLGLTNLVLAVILDQALENRDVNLHKQAEAREKELQLAQRDFMMLCAELDTDHSGSLSIVELLAGYEHDHFRAVLTMLDIQKSDLMHVFNIMDEDKSGGLSYEEFATKFHSIKSSDLQTMLSFTKHYVIEMYHMLETQSLDLKELRAAMSRQSKRIGCSQVRNGDGEREVLELSGSLDPVSADVQDLTSCADADRLPLPADADRLATGPSPDLLSLPKDARGECREVRGAAAGLLWAQMQELREGLENQVSLLQESLIRDIELKTAVLHTVLLQGEAPRGEAGGAAEPRASEGRKFHGPLVGLPDKLSQRHTRGSERAGTMQKQDVPPPSFVAAEPNTTLLEL